MAEYVARLREKQDGGPDVPPESLVAPPHAGDPWLAAVERLPPRRAQGSPGDAEEAPVIADPWAVSRRHAS